MPTMTWRWNSWSSATRNRKLGNVILVPSPVHSDGIEIGVEALHLELEHGHLARDRVPVADAAGRFDAFADVGQARGTHHLARTFDAVGNPRRQRGIGVAHRLAQ